MKARYLYKLRPGATAVAALRAEHTLTRWVWNECVHQFRTGNKPTAARLDKLLSQARREGGFNAGGPNDRYVLTLLHTERTPSNAYLYRQWS